MRTKKPSASGGVSMTINRRGEKTIRARGPAAAGALLEAMRERYQGGAAPAAPPALSEADGARLLRLLADLGETAAVLLGLAVRIEALPESARTGFDRHVASQVKIAGRGL